MTDKGVQDTKQTANGKQKENELHNHGFLQRNRYVSDFMQKCVSAITAVIRVSILITDGVVAVLRTFVWLVLKPFEVAADLVKFLIHSVEFVYNVIANYRSISLVTYQWLERQFEKLVVKQIQRFKESLKHRTTLVLKIVEDWLQEAKIYARGAFEISRRLFLLTADYTPGGAWTVTALMSVLTIVTILKLISYAKTFTSLLGVLIKLLLFLVQPAVSTCNEIANVVLFLCQLILQMFYFILGVLGSLLYLVYIFLLGILKWHWRGLQRLLQLEIVQYMWCLTGHVIVQSIDLAITTLLPFILETTLVIGTMLMESSCKATHLANVLYGNFFAVVFEESKVKGVLSPFTITVWFLLVIALVYAYRTRNFFPDIMCSEIEENGKETNLIASRQTKSSTNTKTSSRDSKSKYGIATESSLSRRYSSPDPRSRINSTSTRHRTTDDSSESNEDKKRQSTIEGLHIHVDASRHKICTEFILDKCDKTGPECDHHHCPRPYHWQYRLGHSQWEDIGSSNNEVLERLYCNVENALVDTSNIDRSSLNLTTRRYRHGQSTVKVDFEEMRLRVDYERVEIRRLSTESYTRCPESSLATNWVWYWLDENSMWQEYGDEGTGFQGPKQDEIEAAYLRHDTSYDFNASEYSFRIYFSMKPMYQRNTDPLRYTRRLVRRRPVLRTDDQINALREKAKARPRSLLMRLFSFGSG